MHSHSYFKTHSHYFLYPYIQIHTVIFTFLDMKMKWTPEGELNFSVFRKAGQQLKYVGKESTHTPGTLRAIPSGVVNRLAKLTFDKTLPSF